MLSLEYDRLAQKFNRRQLEELRTICQKIVDNPEAKAESLEVAFYFLARLELIGGQLSQSALLLEKLEADNPASPLAAVLRGYLSLKNNDLEKARHYFTQALGSNEGADNALAGLGRIAALSGDLEGAWKCYHDALGIRPNNSEALSGIIELGFQLGRFANVEETIKSFLFRLPFDLDLRCFLASVYLAQHKFSEAREELAKVLLFEADHALALQLSKELWERTKEDGGGS